MGINSLKSVKFAIKSVVAASSIIVLLANTVPIGARQNPAGNANAFSKETIEELKRLQKATLDSDYAYKQVQHLTNNIGPRLSGSPQAQKAVEYVAGELKRLGLEVQLEKVMVPHRVRGIETGALVQFSAKRQTPRKKLY